MGWEDRPYYRDRSSGPGGFLQWLMSGHVSLGTWFFVFAAFLLFFKEAGTFQNSAIYIAVLFVIVLLHEFGHCFGSRMVGGQPTEILMHPFGGLAYAGAPRRPWPNFITVLCGPAVNVLICLICLLVMGFIIGTWRGLPWSPGSLGPEALTKLVQMDRHGNATSTFFFFFWVFSISYTMLLFNLLPVFPLDGGQMLQSILWARIGYYKATYFASVTGMIGAVIAAFLGLLWHNGPLVFLAVLGFQVCLNTYRELKANGPWAYEDDLDYGLGNSWNSGGGGTTVKQPSARAQRKAERAQRAEIEEQQQIDAILAKVSAQGMASLTSREKKALQRATEHQRQRDATRGKRAH